MSPSLLPVFHIVYVGCCLTGDINFKACWQPGQTRTQFGPVLVSAAGFSASWTLSLLQGTGSNAITPRWQEIYLRVYDSQPKARNSGHLKKRGENRRPRHFNQHQHQQPSTLHRLHLRGNDVNSQADWLMEQRRLSCHAALSSRWILCRIPRPDGKSENSLSFMFYYHSSASLIQATGAEQRFKISKH